MCTAILYRNGDAYFGRNLDLERGYGERVVITPRNYEIKMRCMGSLKTHYGMIGMAAVVSGFPLYFEATNEWGLSAAGLNFPGNAWYPDYAPGKKNVTPFEFIPWVLGCCTSVEGAKEKMENLNLVNLDFDDELKLSPLHWIICDQERSVVVESMKGGLKIWDNPFEVLTNNPPFDYHLMNMSNYMGLTVGPAVMKFPKQLPMENYSQGMGALGLPGDFSSASRFVRACFVKENSICDKNEDASVNQYFHILDAVAMPKGCVWTENGYEYTRYSCCCNVQKGIYYYKTYEETGIKAIDIQGVNLDGADLKLF